MAEKTIPWWRKALEFALGGLRSGFGLFSRSARPEPVPEPMVSSSIQESPEEDRTLTEPFPTIEIAADTPAVPADAEVELPSKPEPVAVAEEAPPTEPALVPAVAIDLTDACNPVPDEAVDEPLEAAESELEVEAPVEPEVAETPEDEAVNEVAEEPEGELEAVIEVEPETAAELISAADLEQPAPAIEPPPEAAPPLVAEPEPEPIASPEPAADADPPLVLIPPPSEEEKTAQKAVEKEAARKAARQKKRDEGSEESPFSVIVGQVYDGPLDLLLDLIRKQDIDIYDIPIAIITSQFLAYVNQLRASDVDVAGDFIYTASLLIHIKSKMLLPHADTGPEAAAEDPRRELVERLLEHERFKNAAQMLLEKQMLEAATWSNPGAREFKDDEATEPEIAADTVDLVRIFREILERARNRPVINVEEDSVTVGQMIQFLARRLTMEDKPVALRRLLSHTRSERALIAMFLALLEMVRLQAILLRQDRQFSEIFIKKHNNFDTVMNEGLGNARDDWR
jgi:segregation and condensation protein A